MDKTISRPAKLRGVVKPPGDKSISHRSLIFNAVANKQSLISGLLLSDDILSTIRILQKLGVQIDIAENENICKVYGVGLHGLQVPQDDLDCGNSGTTMRLMIGLLTGIKGNIQLIGDQSLQKRPMERIIGPLNQMGANILSVNSDGLCPIIVHGQPINGGQEINLEIASAQVKSAILLAGLYSDGSTKLIEPIATRDHTERMLTAMGAQISIKDNQIELIEPPNYLNSQNIDIPSDISSAAPWIIAAVIHPDAEILIENVGINPSRFGIIKILVSMGANIEIINRKTISNEEVGDLVIKSSVLNGIIVSKELVPQAIDEIPLIALAACFAKGETQIAGIEELKVKESDRLKNTIDILNQFGGNITSCKQVMIIEGSRILKATDIQCSDDHRMTMLAGIAGLIADGTSSLVNIDSVSISYPSFWNDFDLLSIN
jgi:3-phosphoshikimate 1-carboxyvinyltransferase